jgi:dolichyl-phosphate-mannose-protein mannosyltransferase
MRRTLHSFFSALSRHKFSILLSLSVFGIVLGVVFRAYNLSYPAKQVFDEVYFPVFANQYLHHIDVFDVHPPLGKFLIAIGIALFGNGTLGWRVIPLLFGFGIVGLMGALWWTMFKDKVGALIIATLVAIDGIFIIYSRTGLMDGILFFFIFLSLFLMVKARERSPMIWVATVLGLTVSIKWVGLAILVPVLYVAWLKKRKDLLTSLPWTAFVYFLTVVIGEVLDGSHDALSSAVDWNRQAWDYQATLTATHPYSSPWWSWPLLQKPVLFLYDVDPRTNLVNAMTTRGNTLVWWVSSSIVVVSLAYILYRRFYAKKAIADHPLSLFLIGYAACMLPWIPVHRVLFLYHYMPAYGFALLMLTYWLSYLWKAAWWAVIVFMMIAIGVAIYFMPLAVGWIPVTSQYALSGV